MPSRCPLWWCTSDAADAHSGGARATRPMPTTCWCTSKPTVRYRLVYSRCPHWWCTSGAADAHSGGARATQPMPTICWCTSKPSTIQVGIQPMPTLVVHERHSRCPPYAGARASLQYDTGWYTADAHIGGARATQPMPTLVVHERHGRCPPYAGARASQRYTAIRVSVYEADSSLSQIPL